MGLYFFSEQNTKRLTTKRLILSFGSYYQLLSYEGVSTKSEMEMAAWMTKEKKLAPIPVSAFYKDGSDQKLLRFCFAKSDTTLESAGKILRMI
jgi:methionine aminotransferase